MAFAHSASAAVKTAFPEDERCVVEEGTTEREYFDSYPSVNGFAPTLALLPTVL